jgi:predicted HTH domain antitoxin
MTQTTIAIPSSVTEDETRLYLAMELLAIGRQSCGQAAELAGYSQRAFIELLGKHGAAVINHPALRVEGLSWTCLTPTVTNDSNRC